MVNKILTTSYVNFCIIFSSFSYSMIRGQQIMTLWAKRELYYQYVSAHMRWSVISGGNDTYNSTLYRGANVTCAIFVYYTSYVNPWQQAKCVSKALVTQSWSQITERGDQTDLLAFGVDRRAAAAAAASMTNDIRIPGYRFHVSRPVYLAIQYLLIDAEWLVIEVRWIPVHHKSESSPSFSDSTRRHRQSSFV